MGDFLYSANVTLPIFLVMAAGWALRRKGVLDEPFVATANRFNFAVTLPAMLFRDLASVNIYGVFDFGYVLFCAAATLICFCAAWGLARLFVKEETARGAFVQASFRSSAAVMGLAFIENMYGGSAMGPMMIIGAVPLYNICSVIVLTFEGSGSGQKAGGAKLAQAAKGIAANPVILAIALGMAVSALRVPVPAAAMKTIDMIAKMATPLALVTMGAGFREKEAWAKIRPALAASFLKLVAQPAVVLPVAAYLGFTGEKMVGILIMLAAPATPSCYIMAKNMGNDGELTAAIVAATTLLAAFTLTGWIFLLKSAGLI